MADDNQQTDDDFRGLNFARIEGEALGELEFSPGPGWRSFLIFDRKKKRLARLNVIDFDKSTVRREGELKFARKLSHPVFDPVLDHGKDEDSLYSVSDLALESEPLTSYLEREKPLQPAHGFKLIFDYLNRLKASRKFEKAPKGLEIFTADRLRVAVAKSGKVGLVFSGFGGAETAEPKAAFQDRVSALASVMGLEFSDKDLPKKGGITGFVKWMESFRKDLETTDKPLPRPESEIRKWLAEPSERRDLVCASAPKGMADLVPDLKEPVPKPVKKEKAPVEKASKEESPKKEAPKKEAPAKKFEPIVEKVESKPTPKPQSKMKRVEISDEPARKEADAPSKADAKPELPSMGTMFQRGALLQKVKSGGSESGDEVEDLLPNYEASRSKRKSPMTLAIVFCAVVAILIWLISLNIDVVANSIHKLLGNERKARSGFEQLMQTEGEEADEDAGADSKEADPEN